MKDSPSRSQDRIDYIVKIQKIIAIDVEPFLHCVTIVNDYSVSVSVLNDTFRKSSDTRPC